MRTTAFHLPITDATIGGEYDLKTVERLLDYARLSDA